jgi:hypothetical protein
MNNPIYFTIGHVIMNHLFGQICLFCIQSVLPSMINFMLLYCGSLHLSWSCLLFFVLFGSVNTNLLPVPA